MLSVIAGLKQQLYRFIGFLENRLSVKLKRLFTSISSHGIKNEPDESNQKYIIQLNLIGAATLIINSLLGIIIIFLVDWAPGVAFILTALFWLLPLYYNRHGLSILSRTIPVCLTLIAIFVASCWFLHHALLGSYYLIIAINSTFMFTYKEKKWKLITVTVTMILFIVESTPLKNYLPDFYTLKVTDTINFILLVSVITNILVDLIIYDYITRLREKNLMTKQAQIEQAQARVQIQNDDLKTFSLAASHSMQTPLYVSSYFLEKIEAELPSTANERLKKNIELTKSGLQQIRELAEGLFAYDRIINIEIELTEFDVIKEINTLRKSINFKYPAAAIVLTQTVIFIKANQLLFSTILHNLIDNGIKYNRSAVPQVTIDCIKTEKTIIILVTDNGTGIPENFLKILFEPFKRIGSDVQISPGNGLGLACAKRAADRMRGNLICQRSNKSGSTFKLEIPR